MKSIILYMTLSYSLAASHTCPKRQLEVTDTSAKPYWSSLTTTLWDNSQCLVYLSHPTASSLYKSLPPSLQILPLSFILNALQELFSTLFYAQREEEIALLYRSISFHARTGVYGSLCESRKVNVRTYVNLTWEGEWGNSLVASDTT